MLDLVAGVRASRRPPVAGSATVDGSAHVERAVVMAGAGSAPVPPSSAARCCPVPSSAPGPWSTDSIVGPGAVVGAGARVVGGSVLGDGVVVAGGAVVDGARCPEPSVTARGW